jgi:hypothetical protein
MRINVITRRKNEWTQEEELTKKKDVWWLTLEGESWAPFLIDNDVWWLGVFIPSH